MNTWPPPIASEGELETPIFKGHVIVDDIQEDAFTYTIKFVTPITEP